MRDVVAEHGRVETLPDGTKRCETCGAKSKSTNPEKAWAELRAVDCSPRSLRP